MATQCIRASADVTYDGDGTTWAAAAGTGQVGARKGMPATLVRGNTYYLTDGSYSSYTFSTAVSGSTYIDVKKATNDDHGTSTGWNSSYGDGQAIFTYMGMSTGYWRLNGQMRTDWESGYGIALNNPRGGNWAMPWSANASNIELKYMDLNCTTYSPGDVSQDVIYAVSGGNNNCKIQYCFLHDCPRILLYLVGGSDLMFEYNAVARNNYGASIHGEPLAIRGGCNRIIIRYNKFFDIPGASGIICTPDSGGPVLLNSDWEIYGNIFYQKAGFTCLCSGFVYVINYQSTSGWKIYNNSIVNIDSALYAGIRFMVEHAGVTHTNNQVYNNLWYNCANAQHIMNGGGTPDYNWYRNSLHYAETHEQAGAGDPFIDIGGNDYHLAAHTNSGLDLGAGYQTDLDGVNRANWDRGAYEYNSGSDPEESAIKFARVE